MSIFNRTDLCDCGARKDPRHQWCGGCYEFLTPLEREHFARRLRSFGHFIAMLEKKIAGRRYTVEEAQRAATLGAGPSAFIKNAAPLKASVRK